MSLTFQVDVKFKQGSPLTKYEVEHRNFIQVSISHGNRTRINGKITTLTTVGYWVSTGGKKRSLDRNRFSLRGTDLTTWEWWRTPVCIGYWLPVFTCFRSGNRLPSWWATLVSLRLRSTLVWERIDESDGEDEETERKTTPVRGVV